MPSLLFDDGYGVYEVPTGDRLMFKAGEGADAQYNLPSSFDRARAPSQRGRSSAMGSADRFNSPGSYLKQSTAPGPGSYCAREPQNKPSSRYGVLGPELQRMPERLIFEGVGEGADACYNLQSTFDSSKSPSKSAGGFGNSQRFGKFGSHLAGAHSDAPGPGSYSSPSTVTGEITCPKKAGPAPPRAGDRLSFAPSSGMGDSPGPVYEVKSEFDKWSLQGRSATCGKSDRFNSAGSYLSRALKGDAPGPGSYLVASQSSFPTRPQSAPHTGRHSFRERSVDFGPAGEGADSTYELRSAFDKAEKKNSFQKPSSSFGTTNRFDKHGSYLAKAATSEPGPGAYSPPRRSDSTALVAPGPPPPSSSKGRLDFGPVGEGAPPIYHVKSIFDASPAANKRGPSSCMGSSSRFEGVGAYARPSSAPGPGAYHSQEGFVRASAPMASFASPKMRPPGWSARQSQSSLSQSQSSLPQSRPRSALNSSSKSFLR